MRAYADRNKLNKLVKQIKSDHDGLKEGEN